MAARALGARRSLLSALTDLKSCPPANWCQPGWRPLFSWASTPPSAPVVPTRPATRRYGDREWTDEYSWLEGGGPEVQRVMRQERGYADRWLRRSAPLAKQLHREMLALVPQALVSVPERMGAWEYFVQQLPDRPHPCYMRRPAGAGQPAAGPAGAPAEVVLDVNELAVVHGEYVQVGQMKLSHCGQQVAFTLDAGTGEESFAAFSRDLRSGGLRHLASLGAVVSLEWAAGGGALLATQPNGLGRPWRVVAADAAAGNGRSSRSSGSRVLFEESDERFFVELGRTKDWSYLTINCNSKSASEVHLLPADLRGGRPGTPPCQAEPRLVQARQPGLEYFVEHNGGQLYLLSNAAGADNYAVFRVPAAAASLGQEHWQLVVPEEEGTAIEDMDMTAGALVLYRRRRGRQQVAALPLRDGLPAPAGAGAPAAVTAAAAAAAAAAPAAAAGAAAAGGEAAAGQLQVAPLPDWALSVVAGANADFRSSRLRLMLSSPVHPESAFDWDLASGRMVAREAPAAAAAAAAAATPRVQRQEPPAGKLLEGLAWRQLWAASADGTAVPLTVASGGGAGAPAQPRPCLLVVYGAYGHCLPTEFLAQRIPLLHRGWVLALAHARGGGELGRRWHAAGRGASKPNSVADLEACLDLLVAAGYTRPGRVALEAHSAGGLTAGALLNHRPADVGAALLEAPFVDVLSAMCQPELPLTVAEYEEWGHPGEPAEFEQMRQLCPYQNVRPAAYPPTLLTCSQSDLRVPFWGPLKHAARLRAAAARHAGAGGGDGQRGPILLLPDAQAGHFVHERDLYTTKARQYAFLVAALEERAP